MKNRSLVAAIVASAALFTVSATLTSGVIAAPKSKKAPKPAVSSGKVTPKALPGSGGSVSLRVKVNPKGATIQKVRGYAVVTGATTGSQPLDLTLGANNFWEGNVSVPANNRPKKNSAKIFVEVQYAEGNPITKRVANVKLDGYSVDDDSTPPPPPQL